MVNEELTCMNIVLMVSILEKESLRSNKSHQIKSIYLPWSSLNRLTRHKVRILTRLYIGHTPPIHNHLITSQL